MDSSRFMIVYLTMFLLSRGLESSICWKRPYCTCSNGNRMSIYCRYVRDVSDVVGLFKKYTPVYRIRLHGSFTTLPSLAFQEISVAVLWLTAPLYRDIPEDSLSGIRDLRTLVLNETRFESLPDVFSNRKEVQTFHSVRGKLFDLDTELQNMSSITEVVLRENRISAVSRDAFGGSYKILKLDLAFNRLTYLHPETFDFLNVLGEINLSHNHLHSVDGCFRTLNPKSIDLYGNNLTSVDNALHQGMSNLKYLDLGGNPGIRVTSSLFNASLQSLSELRLSNNDISELDPSLIENLLSLRFLYLNGNNLSSVPGHFLEHVSLLTKLELSNNHLTTVDGLLDGGKEWHNSIEITLDGNKLTTVALGSSRTPIHFLDISRNRVGAIRVSDTTSLKKVTYLNLSRNDISFIERESFLDFFSLEILDLSYNSLTDLNLTLQEMPKLYNVYIRSNFLESLSGEEFGESQRLRKLCLGNNSLSSVYGAFRNMKYLAVLDLSMNNLTTLTVDSFPPFQKTSIRVSNLWMANNPWACDCRLAWFASWVRRKGSKLMDEPICSSPTHKRGLPIRSLNQTDFERWLDDCPDTCACACKADGLRVYTVVRCVGKRLKVFPNVLPPNARKVYLQENALESFDSQDVLRLEQLESLNLENNRIEKVRITILPPKLSSLGLASNALRAFPLVDQWRTGNVSVTLSKNPWSCDCDTWAFRNWLIQHNDSVADVSEVRCGSQESYSLRNKPIIWLTRKDLCADLSGIIIISVGAALLSVMCLCLVICCRKTLAACLSSCSCTFLKRSRGHDYPYDAFLVYSEEDEDLALGELAKGLEDDKQHYFLCIPTRDITLPRTSQKVTAYLAQCAKVIVLLTRNFIENQECSSLLASVASLSTDSSSKCVIFVTRGDLPPDSQLDPVLKTLLRSCPRLRWGHCLFWKKLVHQLPKRRSNRNYDDTNDHNPLTE